MRTRIAAWLLVLSVAGVAVTGALTGNDNH